MTMHMLPGFGSGVPGWTVRLALCGAGVLYIFISLFVGWGSRFWKAPLCGSAAALALAFLFTPWTSFSEVTTGNPNVLFWKPWYEFMAFAWLSGSAAALISPPLIWRLRQRDGVRPRHIARRIRWTQKPLSWLFGLHTDDLGLGMRIDPDFAPFHNPRKIVRAEKPLEVLKKEVTVREPQPATK